MSSLAKQSASDNALVDELLARLDAGVDLRSVLTELLIRSQPAGTSEMLASVLLLDEDGLHLREGAAPALPAAYNAAIDGITIGPSVGSCGTAAFCGHPIYVADIATDPLWREFKDLALAHGLRACWSVPIQSRAGKVLGTFALYYRTVRMPNDADRALVREAARAAGLLIERARS